MSSTWQKNIFCPGKTAFILLLSQISEGCLPEQVEGEVEMEDNWCRRVKWNKNNAFGQLLEISYLHGRVTTRTMSHGFCPVPEQEASLHIPHSKAFSFFSGMGCAESIVLKKKLCLQNRTLSSSHLSVPNGFPLLFARLFGESWEAGMPRTFCSETCAAFRIV